MLQLCTQGLLMLTIYPELMGWDQAPDLTWLTWFYIKWRHTVCSWDNYLHFHINKRFQHEYWARAKRENDNLMIQTCCSSDKTDALVPAS